MSRLSTCWTDVQCVEQAILRLKEHPETISWSAEKIQDETDMPFKKTIIDQAKNQYLSHTFTLSTHSIATAMECVEQVKMRLNYQLPANFDPKECWVQKDFNLPFRKAIIKTALFDLCIKQK